MIATSHFRVTQCLALAASIFTALSLCLVAQTPVKLPKDAQTLQTSYHEARQQALLPVERKYREELEKLLAVHTKAGRIDEALAIRTELALLTPEFTAKLLMERPWSYTMASFKTEWKFKPDNTVSSGRWSISGKILRLDFPDSWNEFSTDLHHTPEGLVLVEIRSSAGIQGAKLTQKSK